MYQSPPLKQVSATTLFIKHYKSTSSINFRGKPPQPATHPGNKGSSRTTNLNLANRPGNMGDIRTGIGFQKKSGGHRCGRRIVMDLNQNYSAITPKIKARFPVSTVFTVTTVSAVRAEGSVTVYLSESVTVILYGATLVAPSFAATS